MILFLQIQLSIKSSCHHIMIHFLIVFLISITIVIIILLLLLSLELLLALLLLLSSSFSLFPQQKLAPQKIIPP